MELTESDNKFLDMFKGKTDTTQEDIEEAMSKSEDYEYNTPEEISTAAERVLEKLRQVNSEYLSWFEMLLAIVFGVVGYNLPVWLLYFQAKMRQIEMEDEVMQFQTIILMLMRIERVNVEMILEWLERYSNIFKDPITGFNFDIDLSVWDHKVIKDEDRFYIGIKMPDSQYHSFHGIHRNGNAGTSLL